MLSVSPVTTHESAVEVATVVSTQPTVAPPIVSPPVYVMPSTGASVIALVERRITTASRSSFDGVVYEIVDCSDSVEVAVRVLVLLLRRTETELEM